MPQGGTSNPLRPNSPEFEFDRKHLDSRVLSLPLFNLGLWNEDDDVFEPLWSSAILSQQNVNLTCFPIRVDSAGEFRRVKASDLW